MSKNREDMALVRRALAGDLEAAETINQMRPVLISYLISKGASDPSTAEEVVADVLGECFGARQRSSRASTNRLLELYKGNGPLIAWLKRCCWNAYVDLKRAPLTTPLSEEGDEVGEPDSGAAAVKPESDVVAQIVDALEHAFSELDPLTLVFLRLVYLEGVDQTDVAVVFDRNDSTVSRRVNNGLKALRDKTTNFLKRTPGSTKIEWGDLLAICQTPPEFIYES
jgi:DNA-directed RNA polymerase specialized sigma24 family protein